MKHIVKMPSIPGLGEEAVVLEWSVSPGASVQVGQTLMVVETDKVTVDVPSPLAGTITELLASIDQPVEVGMRLCSVEGEL